VVDVIVVIATSMRRTRWLLERSLRSVYTQSVKPFAVYIVDDNEDQNEFAKIKHGVLELRKKMFATKASDSGCFHTKVLRNKRTRFRSGSGAWNTAAFEAYHLHKKKKKIYLALLDDDDAWSKHYLRECVDKVNESKGAALAVVASGERLEKECRKDIRVSISELSLESFYQGNPGWQGSNTFVKLSAFWKTGGFDESMPSTHDRDFAIRMIKLSKTMNVPILTVEKKLWSHYVHSKERVTSNMEAKHRGLDIFYEKYAFSMSPDVLQFSLNRAQKLFNYVPSKQELKSTSKPMLRTYTDAGVKHIIIAVTSSNAANIRKQLNSISKQLDLEPNFTHKIHYVVLSNGCVDIEIEINRLLSSCCDARMTVTHVTQRKQYDLLKGFPFKDMYKEEKLSEKSIAFSRSLLQFIAWKEAFKFDDVNVLILDDDLLFEAIMLDEGNIKKKNLNFFSKIVFLSKQDADIVISAYTGSPPLPFYALLRTQLLDIYYGLLRIRGMGNRVLTPSFQGDYYYDLSRSTFDHLERPYHIGLDTLDDIFLAISRMGKQQTTSRPLLFCADQWNQGVSKESFYRGGIALFNNVDLLVRIPHLSPCIHLESGEYKRVRRSDFISTIGLQAYHGAIVREACLPLHHDRTEQTPCVFGKDKMAIDIYGAVFYRCFKNSMNSQEYDVSMEFGHAIREEVTRIKVNDERISSLVEDIQLLLCQCNPKPESEICILKNVKDLYAEVIQQKVLGCIKNELMRSSVVNDINVIRNAYL